MIGRHWFLATLIAVAFVASPAAGGIDFFNRKPKSEAQVKKIVETLRTDAEAKKRRAAIAELRETDPRAHPDVIPALIVTLQKDSSAAVRQDAVEAIGSFKLVYPLAGLALEAASELDSSREVRDAALQALWEYHLAGYRSPRGANGFAGQTSEPPIARPLAIHRPPVAPAVAEISVPMQMPAAKRHPKVPPAVSPPPAPAAPPNRPLLNAPIFARRPVLDSIAQLRSLLPGGSKPRAAGPTTTTPEPPIAVGPTYEPAPEPRAVVHIPHVVMPQPYFLPPVAEPPGELPSISEPMQESSELPVGPRARPLRWGSASASRPRSP